MRCKACNVDLGEEYTKCPLCKAEASDDDTILKNIDTAGYPKYNNLSIERKKGIVYFPQKYFVRISMIICAIIYVISLFEASFLFEIAVSVILIINAIYCFICGLFEKGRLLHSSISLLSVFMFSCVFMLLGFLSDFSIMGTAVSLLTCATLFLLLFAIKPKKLTAQMKALFNF